MTRGPFTPPLPGHVLVLRTCHADGRPVHEDAIATGFVWPLEVGETVEAPDWDPTPECGHGLHGLLWGEGSTAQWLWDADARWLVLEVLESEVVEIQDDGTGPKVKFPRCRIVCCGDQQTATEYLRTHGGEGHAIVAGTATAGYAGTATAGARGTATAGDAGTATAGDGGTATAGYGGTATAGDGGTATAGYGGTATAGYAGCCTIRWWNGHRYRWAIREVGGEGGLKPDTPYHIDDAGNWVEDKRP